MPKYEDTTGSEVNMLVFPAGELGRAHQQLCAALGPGLERQLLAQVKHKQLLSESMHAPGPGGAFWV